MPRKPCTTCLLLLSLLFGIGASSAQKKLSPKDLPERFRKWLEEDVVYIITPKEKDVFLQLETDRERDLFIEAFWNHRDPNPATPENEFKKEHYRRIQYANTWFGRGTPTAGWRTDMGRIYIILGPPQSIEKYENETEVYPTVVWFYQGMSPYGLPDAFNVVFFKKYGSGDYELYSPFKDGPQSLLVHYHGDPMDYQTAFEQLKRIRPPLAYTSLTLIPTEGYRTLSPSVASEILLANIDVKPQKAVRDDYAEKLLKYKDIVEVEYTANYIGNDSWVWVSPGPSGVAYVHYLIEPERLSVDLIEDTYHTTLEVSGKVADMTGRTVYQFSKAIPIRFGEEELRKMRTRPFSFQDLFPVVSGSYRFDLMMKNRVSKEFTSAEKDILCPEGAAPAMTPLVLAPHVRNVSSSEAPKPFRVGHLQLYPSATNTFSVRDTLHIFFEASGLDQDVQTSGRLETVFFRDGEEFLRKTRKVSDFPGGQTFLQSFPLEGFPPAHYRVEVRILTGENRVVLSEEAPFSVAPVEAVPKPFIYAERAPSADDPMTDYILGGQLFNLGEKAKAEAFLERAYRKRPQELLFAEGLARVSFARGKYQAVKTILEPFLTENPSEDYRFLNLLGQARQMLREYEEAIRHYKDYLARYGTHLEVLNAIGYCYLALGQKDAALEAWEKSLELNPDQPRIQRMVASLKGER